MLPKIISPVPFALSNCISRPVLFVPSFSEIQVNDRPVQFRPAAADVRQIPRPKVYEKVDGRPKIVPSTGPSPTNVFL